MKTKLLKIERTITCKRELTIEVPEHTTAEEILSTLQDEYELFDEIDSHTDIYEHGTEDTEWEVNDTTEKNRNHLPFDKIQVAMEMDELIPEL